MVGDIENIKSRQRKKLLNQIANHPEKFCYNLGSKSLEFPIYRFVTLDSLFEMLLKNKITLVRTSLWDDVYENYFLKRPIIIGNTKTTLIHQLDGLYGQCWTKLAESDALWRIYSSDKRSVRIKSSIGKLIAGIVESPELNPMDLFKISAGIVSYHTEEYLNNLFEQLDFAKMLDSISSFIIDSSFQKRIEFTHEQEVRIVARIAISKDEKENQKEIVKEFSINPNHIIEEVTFDPRCTNNFYSIYSNLIKKSGFKHTINRSSLYDFK